MILVNKKTMLENTRYRSRFMLKFKENPSILFPSFDISYMFDNKKKMHISIKPIFHILPKLDIIYKLINRKFPKEIVLIIIDNYLANYPNNFINLNKKINLCISSSIRYLWDKGKYIVSFQSNTNKLSNTLNIDGYKQKYLIEYINLLVNEKLTDLINTNKSFEIDDIYKLNNNLFEFIQSI